MAELRITIERVARPAFQFGPAAGLTVPVGVETRLQQLEHDVAELADTLRKVEKDLDSRVDYALRQLGALDAPRGEDLERLERGNAVKLSVVSWLAGDHAAQGGSWITTGALSRNIGWPMEELEGCLHELTASGELEHRNADKLDLWRLPQEQVVEVQFHVGGVADPAAMARQLGRAIHERGGCSRV